MSQSRVYTLPVTSQNFISGTHTGTLIQVVNASTQVLDLVRAWFGQTSITVSSQQAIAIVRKLVAATVTNVTPVKLHGGDPASSVVMGGGNTTGMLATAEGTDGFIDYPDAFSMLNGWLWTPTDKEEISVPPSGMIALKLMTVPAGTTVVSAGLTFRERG
jgi:hypothetical protein